MEKRKSRPTLFSDLLEKNGWRSRYPRYRRFSSTKRTRVSILGSCRMSDKGRRSRDKDLPLNRGSEKSGKVKGKETHGNCREGGVGEIGR